MRAPTLAPIVLLACLLASGCTAVPIVATTPPVDAATPIPTTTPSPTPTPTPIVLEEIVLSMDHLTYTHDGVTDTISFDDGAGVLAVFGDITDKMPEGYEPDGWYNAGRIRYEWSAVTVGMFAEDETHAWVVVTATEVGGVPVRTREGITVGTTRQEAVAAGARDAYDQDQDGVSDYLEVGRQEVPGTTSLITGGVGILFMSLVLEGDTVSQISTSGNDFSDI